jgi:RNA 2',3'-cyclic 3'-phosphodiesterase
MARDRASRPEAKPLRLFIAVDVPAAIRAELAAKMDRFRRELTQARWTDQTGWHVTLKFLGATWPRLVKTVQAALDEAAGETEPFETTLTDVGVFPSARRARVVWAGLADPGGRFAQMVKTLDHLLVEYFIPERRGFTPHLTLARLNPPRDVGEFAQDLVGTPVPSEPFTVDRMVLYRSRLSPKGAMYEPLYAARFGSGTD